MEEGQGGPLRQLRQGVQNCDVQKCREVLQASRLALEDLHDEDDNCPMHWCAAALEKAKNMPNGALKLVETAKFMAAEGSSINMRNMLGESPLIAVARAAMDFPAGAEAVTKELLNRNADPNKADMMGETALMEAASANQVLIGKLLLEHHADPGAVSKSNLSPLNLAEQAGHSEFLRLLGSKAAKDAAAKALELEEERKKAQKIEEERAARAQELLEASEKEERVDRNPFARGKTFAGIARSQAKPAPGAEYPEQGTLHDID